MMVYGDILPIIDIFVLYDIYILIIIHWALLGNHKKPLTDSQFE